MGSARVEKILMKIAIHHVDAATFAFDAVENGTTAGIVGASAAHHLLRHRLIFVDKVAELVALLLAFLVVIGGVAVIG